ncbi:MAG: N-acetylmuramoyl-L-alanine amidase [Chitinophagaceae bacterium]
MKQFIISSGMLALVIISLYCSPSHYAATNKSYKKQAKAFARLLAEYPVKDSAGLAYAGEWVGTTNFSMRRPNFVIIHHTAQNSCDQTLKTFTLPRTQVSSHYVICRDGTVYHMLNDLLRGHHAGVSKWGNTTDLNSCSVGIELDNNGFEYFSDAQINSLLALLGRLKKAYNIPSANFIGHGDIAPTRKNDPNWRFPWKQLAEQGFGNWYEDPSTVNLPPGFDHLQALRIIGFDMKDTNAAIVGFKRHWLQDTTRGLSEDQKKVLFQLSKKFQ